MSLKFSPPIYDQLQQGSCAANELCSDIARLLNQAGFTHPELSRQFLYNQTRIVQGNFGTDGGTIIGWQFKTAMQYGIAPESDLPYSMEHLYSMPSQQAYAAALNVKLLGSTAINIYQNSGMLAQAIDLSLKHGQEVEVSMSIHTGLFYETPGHMTYDTSTPIAGGHAMGIVAVDFATQTYTLRSSWGTGIGEGGYVKMTFSQLNGIGTGDPNPCLWALDTIDGVTLNGQTIDVKWTPERESMSYAYLAFARSADKGGLYYWADTLHNGAAMTGILDFFVASGEGQALYGSTSDYQFVDKVYQNIFGRAGDPAGVTWWASHLVNETRGQLINDIITAVKGSTGVDHDALFNRSLVVGNGAMAYQDIGQNHAAELAALVGVNNNYATVENALHGLHTALYGY